MAFIDEALRQVKAFIFDVDGVLSKDTTPLDKSGDPMRTANVKDGFAIRNAIRLGFDIAIMTGGFAERVKLRYQMLGVRYYYDDINDKEECLRKFLNETKISPDQVLYMGDDLVDFKVMKMVGVPACPMDAVDEIKEIARYISDKNGGEGCVRDVIEQVLKSQDKWMDSEAFYHKSF